MIEYTITPMVYDAEGGFLEVNIVPVEGSPVSLQPIIVAMSPLVLQQINEAPDLAAQKAIVRRQIIRYNNMIQSNWTRELAISSATYSTELLSLLGVPGTTTVTQAEVTEANTP
jgi:hypothetical protein